MFKEFIPLSIPVVKGNELKYVQDAINTAWLADGEYITKFEEKVYIIGIKY